jgi:phospholipid/cholesterol/gamma-HCH transport system substrate-binding protein
MTRPFKVGVFIVFGLALTMLAIFLIGDTRRLWESKTTYRAAFQDVAGLKPGAPVRMGGLDVGSVTNLSHGESLSDTRIFVRMSVSKQEISRIRSDSIARVVNKGLLGDKMVELSVGSPQASPLEPGSVIPSEEPADVLASANRVVAVTEQTIQHVGALAQTLGDPKLAEDIKGSVADLHALLDAMVHGDGPVHRLMFDRREADQIDELIVHLNRTSARLDSVLASAQDVTDHVRQGPGIAHALVYDGEISKDVAGSIDELHSDLRAIREGHGLAHQLLYGDDSSAHVMSNLNAMSDDLRVIVAGIRQGKGTIGALLVDPTVYEDIKSAIGNVERNEVLRALVRYSIKADEKHPAPSVTAKP